MGKRIHLIIKNSTANIADNQKHASAPQHGRSSGNSKEDNN